MINILQANTQRSPLMQLREKKTNNKSPPPPLKNRPNTFPFRKKYIHPTLLPTYLQQLSENRNEIIWIYNYTPPI